MNVPHPDFLDKYLEFVENTEPAYLYNVWCALSAVASVLQRKCWLEWGHDKIHTNMYIVLVGPPGARKGTAMKPTQALLRDVGIKFAAESATKEALIREFEDCDEIEIDKNNINTLLSHSSLTAFLEELTVFMRTGDNLFVSFLNRWYDCPDPFTYNTIKGGSVDIPNLWFNLLGATTPELMRSNLSVDVIGSGFPSRVVFVYASTKRKVIARPDTRPELKDMHRSLVETLSKINLLRGTFKYTEAYMKAYEKWYVTQEDDKNLKSLANNGMFEGYLNRRPTHLRKVSMALNASRGGHMVLDLEDFLRAKDLLEKTEVFMRQAFEGMGNSTNREQLTIVLRLIVQNKKMTLEQLQRLVILDVTASQLDEVLRALEIGGFIKRTNHLTPQGVTVNLEFIPREE